METRRELVLVSYVRGEDYGENEETEEPIGMDRRVKITKVVKRKR